MKYPFRNSQQVKSERTVFYGGYFTQWHYHLKCKACMCLFLRTGKLYDWSWRCVSKWRCSVLNTCCQVLVNGTLLSIVTKGTTIYFLTNTINRPKQILILRCLLYIYFPFIMPLEIHYTHAIKALFAKKYVCFNGTVWKETVCRNPAM